jgi:hypothetical protein
MENYNKDLFASRIIDIITFIKAVHNYNYLQSH